MKGNVVLVTGATDGIGKVTALELARMGATVVVAGRNPEKGGRVVSEIIAETGNNNVELMLADLSSMAEVKKLADTFKRKYDRLDVLVNNAGALFIQRKVTVDGYEMTFALNHLSYFLLTHLLLDVLKASAPARIVNVSSDAHYSGTLDFDDLQHEKRYGRLSVYSDSKLANVVFTFELARRLDGTGVSANVLHPGFVATRFGHNNGRLASLIMTPIHKLFALSPEQGAQTSVYLAASPEVDGVSGQYFENSKPVRVKSAAYDQTAWTRLWEASEKLVAQWMDTATAAG